ncbi:acetate CoA-transferase subunit alpha [Budvicia diplopodorum]|uniref:acetate CoA-transferase subunit alpha n=1 Tax=Budvicia diplopodorum TaxID=1119056 RepID=UPI001356A611|nr:acetate CoA-transferase subunit alpha [Budvicia diplopodorum]
MKAKLITLDSFSSQLRDGMSIMFGGFMGNGTPPMLINALLNSGVKDLTLIGNDTAVPGLGVAPLIAHKRVRKVIASHIGLNPETGRQMMSGEMEVELVPQGTLVERIRAGGAGLGGFLTPTGVGTVVEEGKQRMTINGRDYLLELPLRADLALVHAKRGDRAGNLYYRRSARNFNPVIALAADRVFAEVEELVNIGELDPDLVMTPAMLIDGLIQGGAQ